MKTFLTLLTCSVSSLSLATGQSTFDEALSGDISDNYLAPTPFTVGLGNNILSGSLSGGTNDLDLFELIVPNGLEVTAIRLLNYNSTPSNNGSFLLLQPGNTLSIPPSNTFADPIGFSIIGSTNVGSDLLPTIIVPGASTLAPFFGTSTLTSGSYAGWLNETGAAATYSIQFETSAIPEPSTSLFLALTAFCCVTHRRR